MGLIVLFCTQPCSFYLQSAQDFAKYFKACQHKTLSQMCWTQLYAQRISET